MKISLEVQRGLNHQPKYGRLEDHEFRQLTRCEDCHGIAQYEDQHTSAPCKNCGGEVKIFSAGRWNPSEKVWECRENNTNYYFF